MTVYVAPDGSLSYTLPHSVSKPEGSIVDGWTKTESENLGNLAFKDGLIACPVTEGKPRQVFAQLPGLTFGPDCLGFNALTCMFFHVPERAISLLTFQPTLPRPAHGSIRGFGCIYRRMDKSMNNDGNFKEGTNGRLGKMEGLENIHDELID
jgi:hypothetical protein